ncbi:hypothetical protein JCM11251_006777 [Rhodosporidiobolus azoricus]
MRTTPTALLLALSTLLALLPHFSSTAASPSPPPPSNDPQERLALALGQNSEQYIVTGVGAPAVPLQGDGAGSSKQPPHLIMDTLPGKMPSLMEPAKTMDKVGRRFASLWERTEEEIARGEKREVTVGGGGWERVERRGRGQKRLPRYGDDEEESMR